jgi:hypothetical protein
LPRGGSSATPAFFPLEATDDLLSGLPGVGEGAFAGGRNRVIPHEPQKLLERRAPDQVQAFR